MAPKRYKGPLNSKIHQTSEIFKIPPGGIGDLNKEQIFQATSYNLAIQGTYF